MSAVGTDLLERLLRQCARQRPTPVFPAEVAQASGMDLEQIEAAFDHLRTMKMVFLTDWIQGHGRGFIITEDGVLVLNDHVLLDRLRYQPVAPQPGVLSAPPKARDTETQYAEPGPEEESHHAPAPFDRAAFVRDSLLRRALPFVTFALVLAIVVVFLIGLSMAFDRKIPEKYIGIMPDLQVALILHDLGLLLPDDVLVRHEWWRLWANVFVQGWGILGLFLGLWYMYSLGSLSEAMWGPWRFLGLIFTCVLGGSSAALFWDKPAWNILATDWGMLAGQVVWLIANHGYLPKEAAAAWKRSLLSNLVFHVVIYAILLSQVPGLTSDILAIPAGAAIAGGLFAIPALFNRYFKGATCWAGLAGMIAVPAVILMVVFGSFDVINENRQAVREGRNKAKRDADLAEEKERREKAERDLHGKAITYFERVYRQNIEKLLVPEKRGKEFDDLDFIADTKKDLRAACAELTKAIDYLEKEQPFGNMTGKAIALDRHLHKFFQNFLGALENRQQFVDKRVELINQANAVHKELMEWRKIAKRAPP